MNVDIYAAAFGRNYEFELDEELSIEALTEEIVAAICQKEHCAVRGELRKTLLLHDRRKRVLSRDQTVVQAEIENGDTLTLI